MAFTLKTVGSVVASALAKGVIPKPKAVIRPKAPPPAQSPFRTVIGGEFPQKDPDQIAAKTAPSTPAPQPAAKLVIKPKGTPLQRWKPSPKVDDTPTERQTQNLEEAGLGVAKLTAPEVTGPHYDRCQIGKTRVTITNGHFPWVKHYKPGDSGLVTHIGNNKDPLGIDDTSHLVHVIKIDKQADGKQDRVGQTAALFRWEFMIGEGIPQAQWEGMKVVSE